MIKRIKAMLKHGFMMIRVGRNADDLSAVTQNHVSVNASKYAKLHARERVYTRKLSTPVNMLSVALLAQVVLCSRSNYALPIFPRWHHREHCHFPA